MAVDRALDRTTAGYWRSVERLLDSPGVTLRDPGSGDEFPRGASLPPDGLSRRRMLGIMGGSFALAGLAACRRPVETIVPFVDPPEVMVPGIAKHYATTATLGDRAFGLLVEAHDGRPTKIEGNPLHPASGGAASSWMQASVLDLYDPDRSRSVEGPGNEGALREGASRDGASRDGAPEFGWGVFARFWGELAERYEAAEGAGLAVVVPGYASPTLERLRSRFLERFPRARFVVFEPLAGHGPPALVRATGRTLRASHHLDSADRILVLDADPLLTGDDPLRAAAGFAEGRGRTTREGMNRLYAVESALSVTGAAADHRVALPRSEIPRVTLELARRVAAACGSAQLTRALPAGLETEREFPWLDPIAADLAAAGPRALVVAGDSQPPEVHLLILAIHTALGAIGETLTLHERVDSDPGSIDALVELVDEMRGGRLSTLAVLGCNPAYAAPSELDFAGALAKVETTIHLGPSRDETGSIADWHLPEAHFLESWADARSLDGMASVVQPLIQPLHGGRSVIEALGLLISDELKGGFELVQETWLGSVIGGSGFEAKWNRALHDGFLADSAGEPVELAAGELRWDEIALAADRCRASTAAEALELSLHPSPATWDGRFANNAWLSELPQPITQLTWDNALLMAPATAEHFAVTSGDRVLVTAGDRSLEVAVLVQPGHAEGAVSLTLGHGRRRCGRVGDGVGFDANRLRSVASPWLVEEVTIEPVGRRHLLAGTQEHWSMEGREIVREATLADYLEHPEDVAGHRHHAAPELWRAPSYDGDEQWAMAIDLNACIGCNACVTACQAENNIPVVGKEQVAAGREMHWLRVDRYFHGEAAEPAVLFQPVPCMHCEAAPCEEVCPVGATVHDANGLNAMVYNRCIGTRYCSNNCPYKVRRFNFFNYTRELPELMQMAMNPDVTVRSRGVMEKCSYCVQRLNEGRRRAGREERRLSDGEVQTACQQTCPTRAIEFGDLTDADSAVVGAKAGDRDYALLEELNTRPRTSYQVKLRNPNPDWSSP